MSISNNNIKRVYLFISPKLTERDHPIIQNLAQQFPLLETEDIRDFYDQKIAKYSARPPKCFCNGLENLIADFANEPNNVTLISMNEKDVFAILVFNIKYPNYDIYIELLCGNKALPKTGEGTRLLKIVENAGLETGNVKIKLSAVSGADPFYEKNSYHSIPNSRTFYSVSMEKNTRALSNWSKVRASLSASAKRYLDKEYSRKKGKKAKGNGKKSKKSKKSKNSRKVKI